MAFNKKNAAEIGRKAGKASASVRWGDKDPDTVRNRQIKITVSRIEQEMIDQKSNDTGLSRTELIVRAVREYDKALAVGSEKPAQRGASQCMD